jgi:hypothetical protein
VKWEANDDEPKHSHGSLGGSIVIFGYDSRNGARRHQNNQEGSNPDDVSYVRRRNVQHVLRRLSWKGWKGGRASRQ